MPKYYFHLLDKETIPDSEGTELADLAEARRHADVVARELTYNSAGILDRCWSEWTMSVHDDHGKELFSFRLSEPSSADK